jgi:DNA-binding transcriptional MerR regulator
MRTALLGCTGAEANTLRDSLEARLASFDPAYPADDAARSAFISRHDGLTRALKLWERAVADVEARISIDAFQRALASFAVSLSSRRRSSGQFATAILKLRAAAAKRVDYLKTVQAESDGLRSVTVENGIRIAVIEEPRGLAFARRMAALRTTIQVSEVRELVGEECERLRREAQQDPFRDEQQRGRGPDSLLTGVAAVLRKAGFPLAEIGELISPPSTSATSTAEVERLHEPRRGDDVARRYGLAQAVDKRLRRDAVVRQRDDEEAARLFESDEGRQTGVDARAKA